MKSSCLKMAQSKLPQSARKHIRQEKARIRREILDVEKQQELIDQLYQKFLKKRASRTRASANLETKE